MIRSTQCGKWAAIALAIAAESPVFGNIVGTGDLSPIDPTTWTASTTGIVGQTGVGGVTVNSGSTLNSGTGYLGFAGGSQGSVTVDGTSSKWINTNILYVGSSGTATLTISGGGSVTDTVAYVGYDVGAIGSVFASGTNSSWASSSSLTLGYSGIGMLSVTNGAKVSNASAATGLRTSAVLGFNVNAAGIAQINGVGTAWNVSGSNNSGSMYLGYSGAGTLSVAGGAKVTNAVGYMGFAAGGSGNATVDGSLWTNTISMWVLRGREFSQS